MDWVRQQASPRQRERDAAKDIEVAKQQLKEAGTSNIFETAHEPQKDGNQVLSTTQIKEPKPKPTQV